MSGRVVSGREYGRVVTGRVIAGRVMPGRVLLLFLAACTVAEKTEKGPTIHIDLIGDIDDVTDQDTNPSLFLLSGHTQYSIDVSLTTSAGSSTSDTFSNYRVDSFSTSFAVGSTPIADDPSNYTDDDYTDATFTRSSPILIPASSKGQMLKIHVDATDSRGLASNVIDFSVALD